MAAFEAAEHGTRTYEAQVLMGPLLRWLIATQRLRAEAGMFLEFPWAGRRIDLVILGKRLRTSAFELKLHNTGRVLEQAIYNRAAFDRSYMVVAHVPSDRALADAQRCGVGVLLVESGNVRLAVESPLARPTPTVRKRLLRSLQSQPRLEPAE